MAAPALGALVDTDRYDLRSTALHEACRAAYDAQGVCVLPGFLRADAVAALVSEADALAPLAHRSHARGTPYLTAPDRGAPPGHPRGTVVDNRLEVVAYDQFPAGSGLRALYESDELLDFVAAVLRRGPLFRYGDPFGALNLAVMREGDELGWHFDMTDFVVSIALQAAESGGDFENAARIRSADDEREDAVAAVLRGDAPDLVRVEPMTAGTLMLFNGRWSLHRVSPIRGPVPRYVALLAYDTKPGTDSSDHLKLARYGRLPAERAGASA